jgi:hypothetical protein
MKTFVGRIVTVSDGAGRSVTGSKWGVAQSSRHLNLTAVAPVNSLYHICTVTIFSKLNNSYKASCVQYFSRLWISSVDIFFL